MKKTQFKGVAMLLLTAFIWGSAFVAQSAGMENVEAFTFNGIRSLLGAAVLLPYILISDSIKGKKLDEAAKAEKKKADVKAVKYGLLLGLIFCAASNVQQYAFNYSTSGKIAFITALYMFFVPLLGLFFRKRVPLITWLCVAAGFVGLYFLCINPASDTGLNKGDVLAFICAILFAVHILFVERLVGDLDGVKVSCVQFAFAGIITLVLMFIFESPSIENIKAAALPILYAGCMSCGIAYTFQILGQKYTEATVASLIMCMESVFAVLCGALLLKERLAPREILGCSIMFIAIIVSQLAEKFNTKTRGTF